MLIHPKLLSIIGKMNPAIYDFVFPHGPIGRGQWAALSPQPLPPLAMGALLARHFIHNASILERAAGKGAAALDDLNDWCPTHPKKFKLPPWWWPIPPEPEPGPDWLVSLHLGFAAELAAQGQLQGDALNAISQKALKRSLDIMEKSLG